MGTGAGMGLHRRGGGAAHPARDHQQNACAGRGVLVPAAGSKAVKDIEAEHPDKFQFRVVTADGPSAQVRNIEDMVVWGMEYLVILPHESAPLTPIIKEVQSKGVRVIVVDRALTDTNFGYVNLAGYNPALGTLSG